MTTAHPSTDAVDPPRAPADTPVEPPHAPADTPVDPPHAPADDPRRSDDPGRSDAPGHSDDPGRYIVSRTVSAPPPQVFALLTDPARHHQTEPTDWVRGPLESDPAPLTEVGQVFGIEMFHVNAGGRYDMHNRVIAFEPDRTVAWEPGQYEPDGELGTGGWTWRYDLAPAHGPDSATTSGAPGTGTEVTLTYDWSAVPPAQREEFGLPPFPPEFLEESLAALDRALGTTHAPTDPLA